MINSIALELETFELAKYNAKVILTGASKDGMPSDSSERVNNINEILIMQKIRIFLTKIFIWTP